MELEEMKTLWKEMSTDMEKQKVLTDSLIMKMTRANYRNKISRILVPEAIGAAVCIAGLLYILLNIDLLNTWYLLVSGVITILILGLLPVLSIKAIYKIRSLNISDQNYKELLLGYTKGRLHFVFIQKLNFVLGAILMLTILPVMTRLMGGTDMFRDQSLWYWYAIVFPFFYYFSIRVFKSYIKTTADAEDILKELQR